MSQHEHTVREDPLSHVMMCEKCWNGLHARRKNGCKVEGCKCGCYDGPNDAHTGLVKPEEDQERFKVGTIPL